MDKIKKFIPQFIKNKIHKIQSTLSNYQYGFPSESLKIIGVTGTDGKTTTATMIYQILQEAGFKVGLMTSVSAKIGKREIDTGLHVTTPDPWEVPKFLRKMVDAGLKWVVLETTSQGLDQNRVANIEFEKGVFTNITNEHLDYHKTWRNLAYAKTKLIDLVKEGGEIVYKEDEQGGSFIRRQIIRAKQVLISTPCNDEMALKVESDKEGIKFVYDFDGNKEEVNIPILGKYNVGNALCAIKACEMLAKKETIIKALSKFKGIKGRMQLIRSAKPCTIIVDFAHTSNALKNALKSVSKLKDKGRVIVVFGCAGLRDFKKRTKMGKIAAKYADIIVVTAEDPRTESLEKINSQIISGAKEKKGVVIRRFPNTKSYKNADLDKIQSRIDKALEKENKAVLAFDESSINSRKDALDFAVRIAKSDDIVISTGKGHEKSLCFGNEEFKWSDERAIKEAIGRRYKRTTDN